MSSPREVLDLLRDRGWTIATAESLTAGLVVATLADVPGCSDVVRGSVVAYQPDVKADLLGVSAADIAAGVVSRSVALAMADGVRGVLRADVGIATTGVAGPQPHDGEPVGSVWIAVATPQDAVARQLQLAGDRGQIRRATVDECWTLLEAVVAGSC